MTKVVGGMLLLSTNHLAFEDSISFILFLFIIEVEIPFYEVVDTGFRKAAMKSQLVFEMSEERLEGVRGLRKPGMVDEGEQVGYRSFEMYVGFP